MEDIRKINGEKIDNTIDYIQDNKKLFKTVNLKSVEGNNLKLAIINLKHNLKFNAIIMAGIDCYIVLADSHCNQNNTPRKITLFDTKIETSPLILPHQLYTKLSVKMTKSLYKIGNLVGNDKNFMVLRYNELVDSLNSTKIFLFCEKQYAKNKSILRPIKNVIKKLENMTRQCSLTDKKIKKENHVNIHNPLGDNILKMLDAHSIITDGTTLFNNQKVILAVLNFSLPHFTKLIKAGLQNLIILMHAKNNKEKGFQGKSLNDDVVNLDTYAAYETVKDSSGLDDSDMNEVMKSAKNIFIDISISSGKISPKLSTYELKIIITGLQTLEIVENVYGKDLSKELEAIINKIINYGYYTNIVLDKNHINASLAQQNRQKNEGNEKQNDFIEIDKYDNKETVKNKVVKLINSKLPYLLIDNGFNEETLINTESNRSIREVVKAAVKLYLTEYKAINNSQKSFSTKMMNGDTASFNIKSILKNRKEQDPDNDFSSLMHKSLPIAKKVISDYNSPALVQLDYVQDTSITIMVMRLFNLEKAYFDKTKFAKEIAYTENKLTRINKMLSSIDREKIRQEH